MTTDDNDIPICNRCGDTYELRPGCDPTPECDSCAHIALAEVRNENAKLIEDKARLDWMQEHAREDGRTMAMPRYAYHVKHWDPSAGPNIREAIDTTKKEREAP